jgi:hypothetical protein
VNAGYPAISGVNVVLGNVVPDGVKVEGGLSAEYVAAHVPEFRRVSDFCLGLARASAGST